MFDVLRKPIQDFQFKLMSCHAKDLHRSLFSGGPPLPDLPDQYTALIEANIVDRNLTTTAHEYFDGPGNRATLQMFKDNDLFSLIFDYANDQLFYVYSCK